MLTQKDVEDAIELYKGGASLRMLGKLYKTTYETIRTDLKRAGFTDFRDRGGVYNRKYVDMDAVKELRGRKLNIPEIAAEMGVGRELIRSRFKEEGLDGTYLGPVTRYYDKDEIEKLYLEEKLSLYTIADKLGGSAMTVRRFMLDNGIPTRPTTTPRKLFVEDEVIRKQYLEEGLSTYKLAKLYDVTQTTIAMRLKKLKVKFRHRGCKGL